MELKQKYASLIQMAQDSNVADLKVGDENGVLYINGLTADAATKNKLWDEYGRIDPNFRAGDLVLNVDVNSASGSKAKVVTKSSNLNIRKGPGTDSPIVAKAAHGSEVIILGRASDQWTLIKNEAGVEGYVYDEYLEVI